MVKPETLTIEKNRSNGAKPVIQAVIFDLDGVLMNTEWISYQVWQEVTQKYGGALPIGHYTTMTGMTAEETGEYVMRVTGVKFDLAKTVAYVWQTVTGKINEGIEPLPGSVALLEALKGRGLPLAIASNSPVAYIENALKGLGLRPYFQAISGVDQVERGKPFPDLYLRAAQLLGVSPERCLAVEDSYVGSQAALRAGMRVLAVPAKEDSHDKFSACYGIYESLVQVKDALNQVLD